MKTIKLTNTATNKNKIVADTANFHLPSSLVMWFCLEWECAHPKGKITTRLLIVSDKSALIWLRDAYSSGLNRKRNSFFMFRQREFNRKKRELDTHRWWEHVERSLRAPWTERREGRVLRPRQKWEPKWASPGGAGAPEHVQPRWNLHKRLRWGYSARHCPLPPWAPRKGFRLLCHHMPFPGGLRKDGVVAGGG